MKKIKLFTVVALALTVFVRHPLASSMLGVSTYAATKIVDAIMAGMSVWTILALIATSGGTAGIAVGTIKIMIKRLGRKTAIAW